jgi:hypothetical protein
MARQICPFPPCRSIPPEATSLVARDCYLYLNSNRKVFERMINKLRVQLSFIQFEFEHYLRTKGVASGPIETYFTKRQVERERETIEGYYLFSCGTVCNGCQATDLGATEELPNWTIQFLPLPPPLANPGSR